MPPALRDLVDSPERARALPPEAMAAVLGELILLLARLLVQTAVTPNTTHPKNPPELERLLTVAETATILNLRPARVYELVRRRVLPIVRVGKTLRVKSGDLRGWIEGQREKIMDTNFEPSLSSLPPMRRSMTKAQRRKGS